MWRDRAAAGEPAALGQLVGELLDPLYRFCFYRVGCDRHLCEDVVGETMLRAIDQLDKYDPRRSAGNIFPWLAGLAKNEIRRALADRRSADSLQQFWSRMDADLRAVYARLDGQPLPETLLARQETRQMVNAAMAQLPLHYGSVLEDKYFLGRSVREMAAGRGLTEKAVESLLTRAREAFRATFTALAKNLELS